MVDKQFCLNYSNFKDCIIQTFDDSGGSNKTLARTFKVEPGWAEKAKQLNKQGAWVFFSVNSMNGEKRSKDSIKNLNTRIVECDELTKDEQWEMIEKSPLEPSLIVESKKSLHLYYFCDNTATIDNWAVVNQWLRDYYKWDQKIVKDIARVFRIPGFYHKKNKNEPYRILSYLADPDLVWLPPKYSEKEMLEKFPVLEKEINKKNEIEKTPATDVYNYIWQLNCETMLERLSGSSLINWEMIELKNNTNWTKQIWVNNKSTSNWIDTKWFIGDWKSAFNWITWVEWYWTPRKDIFKWFFDNCKDMIPNYLLENKNPKIKKEDPKKIIIPEKDFEKIGYVFPNNFDCFECMLSGELVTIIGESNSWKTTFAMDILEKNNINNKKWFYINLEFNIETVWQWRRLFFNWKTKSNLADNLKWLDPHEKIKMNNYINNSLKKFDYYNNPKWITLKELTELILEKNNNWYWLFVIDTFSRIEWNLVNNTARTSQNKSMEILQELAQKTGATIIILHHTNKSGKFEGSQKILDLSNMFILISKESDLQQWEYTKFKLIKDKFTSNKEINISFQDKTYQVLDL